MTKSWDAVAATVQFTAPLNMVAFREHVAPNAEILDLGCGYGRVASQLIAAGFTRVRGYDASEKMIKRARVQHPQLCLSIADAAMLPEVDHSVDAVVVAALLTSIPSPDKQRAVVKEIRRVLRRGGVVHGVEFLQQQDATYSDGGRFKSKVDIAMWHFQPDELEHLFASFTGWVSWRENTHSLSGSSSAVLQFMAYAT